MAATQNCSGSLEPATTSDPAFQGDARKPEFVGVVDTDGIDVTADSVVDWVVSSPVTGSGDCSALFSRYHPAIEPYALAARDPHLGLSVANALMQATVSCRGRA